MHILRREAIYRSALLHWLKCNAADKVLAKINSILARRKLNIVGQYLKTNEDIGYVITDINKKYDKKVIKELKEIDETIRFRVLY